MATVWKIVCPVHNEELQTTNTIPFNKDGVMVNCPIFYCDKCEHFYLHTDAVKFGSTFDYGNSIAVNIDELPICIENDNGIVCTKLENLKSYVVPFVPESCYKDFDTLIKTKYGTLRFGQYEKQISGFYCSKCGDFYIEEELYDEILLEISQIDNDGYIRKNDKLETNKAYNYDDIKACDCNTIARDSEYSYISYEECENNYTKGLPFSLLHYAFIFRRFDIASEMINSLSDAELQEALFWKGSVDYPKITPLVCAKWNMNYIEAYDDKYGTRISNTIGPYIENVTQVEEVMEYTDIIDTLGNDVFTVFWKEKQPVLDVVYYEKQRLASKQVEENGYSIVMDEVGTGKTVTAIYAIRDAIQKRVNASDKARILVVCPYNKREDWQNDIRRQLGRYAHIVEQSDFGEMYDENWKQVFFKNNEQIIFIAGQKQGEDKNSSYSALKGTLEVYSKNEPWDLTIIDEAHISFKNYFNIRSEKLMILSATPIVVNSKGKRDFEDYLKLAHEITGKETYHQIEPITNSEPNTKDVYVNWFREDMGKRSAERKIKFISCSRWSKRDDVYYKIKDEKGALAALQFDQDDDYLFWAASEYYGLEGLRKADKNKKIEKLVSLLSENNKSYIIFCEHKFVVDTLFVALKDMFFNCVVAEKYGEHEGQNGLENVQAGQLINTLIQALRDGKRTLFITTGKTGGTGLNLGEFDGIIHYELPFTSIELEQRFGRVDRMDTGQNIKTREMIFMLNECRTDENDMEINRMLYYCTSKIDVTCQFMPIRNTVLYYPEFIKRNGTAIRESLECFKNEYVLSKQNENRMIEIRKNIRIYEARIKNNSLWNIIRDYGRNIRMSAIEALSREDDDRITDEYYSLLNDYLKYWRQTKIERNAFQQRYKAFLEAKRNANNWLGIIGVIKIEPDSDAFVGLGAKNDGEEQEIIIKEENHINSTKQMRTSVQQQIKEMIKLINNCIFDEEDLRSFSSNGVFCYIDGKISRTTVEEYRKGNFRK